ncbi:CRAL/TRIO domain protein [Teladorsagia circumcincta]|uniref:CRAL/TRIO domain protein n=1 Tax=Teladorsagia circumcincta TaxID=45464 RepID=A0A2G9U780_TELCI|nr:CRAL/TRIO domain protein [Teladorsagia circumcincta]
MTVEGHYPSTDEVTAYQKTKIAELRERAATHLAKYPDYDTDFSLLRWLMGWDYDIDVILPKIQSTLDVLKCLRIDEITIQNQCSFRKAEAATGKKLGAKIIIDLDNFSMDVLYPPALNVYLNLLTLLQALFPDFGRHIYVINSPMMIKTVYAMIQPVLSKQTKEKVTFLGNDWKEFLVNELGEHNIYRHWGGSKASDLPTGDVRMGGKVPEKLQYKAEDNVDDDKKDFTKVTVAARSKVEVRLLRKLMSIIRSTCGASSTTVSVHCC